MSHWQAVKEYPNFQYVTGMQQKAGTFMSDATYSEALDALVVCCADAAVLLVAHLVVLLVQVPMFVEIRKATIAIIRGARGHPAQGKEVVVMVIRFV